MQLLLHLVGGLQPVCCRLELLCVGDGVLLPQFLPDELQLLTQDIFPLVLVHSLPHLCLDLLLDVHDLHLIHQFKGEQLVPFHEVRLLQELLQVPLLQRHIGGDPVHHLCQICVLLHLLQHILGIFRQAGGILRIDFSESSDHGLLAHLVRRSLQSLLPAVRERAHQGPHVGRLKFHILDDRSLLPGYQDPKKVPGQLDDLPDGGDGPHLVQVLRCRLLHFYISLGRQKYLLAFLLHGLLDGLDGPLSADVKMGHHLRHHRHAPERHHGEALYFSIRHFIFSCPVVFRSQKSRKRAQSLLHPPRSRALTHFQFPGHHVRRSAFLCRSPRIW